MQGPGFCKPPPGSLQLQDGGAAQWLEHSICLSFGSCGLGSQSKEWDTQACREHGCVWKMAGFMSSPGVWTCSAP